MPARQLKRFGYIPDLPDKRDLYYDHMQLAGPKRGPISLPVTVDLRSSGFMPPIQDQSELGSCVWHSTPAMVDFVRKKQGLDFLFPARLAGYYMTRAIEGTADSDSGCMIRDAMLVLVADGAAPETDWAYDISKFAIKPPPNVYHDAHQHLTLKYLRCLQVLYGLKKCLADGYPFVFGFTVYDSFMSEAVARTGVVPMPDFDKESVQGGHAVLAVGYDDVSSRFIVRNSWGTGWGQSGYFTFPYEYMLDEDLTEDIWTIRQEAA